MNRPRKIAESDRLQGGMCCRQPASQMCFPGKMPPLSPENIEALPFEEIRQMIHEQVHQVDLEMQNVKLRTMQADLDAARANYFDLYDMAPVGYCTLSENGMILKSNFTAATLLGLDRSTLHKQPLSRYILPDYQDIYYLLHKQLFETGEPQTCDLRMLKKDGTQFWAHLTATAAQDIDRALVCRVVITEITEHKRTEEALIESETRLQTLVQTIPDLIWLKDPGGVYLDCNAMFERFFGASKKDIIGKTDYDFVDRELADFFREHDRKAITAGKSSSNEEWLTFADGHRALYDTIKTPMLDAEGKLLGVLGIARDITERKQAEERIFNSMATVTMVIDGISDPLIMLDAELRVKGLNRAARNYYGLTSFRESLGKLCFEAFRGKSSPCEGCERPFSKLHGFSGSYERKGAMDPDKLEHVFVDQAKNDLGEPKAYILRINDITQAKMMERQLIQSEKLASLGLLIAGIAHEINNPNTLISFNIPILRDYLLKLIHLVDTHAGNHPGLELCDMPYQEFRMDIFNLLDEMEHGSRRINTTVSGLKEFSRTNERMKKSLISLKQVIEKALTICGAEIRKRVKSLKVTIPDDLPPLFINPEAVEQVLINLLINAVQAIDKEESWIHVSVLPDFRYGQLKRCIIEVADNGYGMDEKVRSKIFDPFFTTKSSVMGTGLGLYVCRNLIEKLGGSIEVDSRPGVGSSFRVILPDVQEVHGGTAGR